MNKLLAILLLGSISATAAQLGVQFNSTNNNAVFPSSLTVSNLSLTNVTANTVAIYSGRTLSNGPISTNELYALDNITGNIQDQIDSVLSVDGLPGKIQVYTGVNTLVATNLGTAAAGYFTNGPVRVLFAGDSMVEAYAYFPATNRAMARLFGEYLTAGSNWTWATNASYSGLDVAAIMAAHYATGDNLRQWRPASGTNGVFVFWAGLNNFYFGGTAEEGMTEWSNAVTTLRADAWKIVAITPHGFGTATDTQKTEMAKYNQWLRNSPHLWDWLYDLDMDAPKPPNNILYQPDALHARAPFNSIVAYGINEALKRGFNNRYPLGSHNPITMGANNKFTGQGLVLGATNSVLWTITDTNVEAIVSTGITQDENWVSGLPTGTKSFTQGGGTHSLGTHSVAQLFFSEFSRISLNSNSGQPEGAVTAPRGSMWMDEATGEMYFKKSGSGNTGWLPADLTGGTLWVSDTPLGKDAGLKRRTGGVIAFVDNLNATANAEINRIYMNAFGDNVYIDSGAGAPEGAVTAGVGSVWINTSGGAGTTVYIKESGTGNTGWVAISSGGGGGGIVGTMLSSGSGWASGVVPKASDATGTNFVSSALNVGATNATLTGNLLANGGVFTNSLTVGGVDVVTTARTITAGAGISGGGDLSANRTITFAPSTFVDNISMWDASQATRTWTANLSGGTDPVWTYGNNSADLTAGVLKYGGNNVVVDTRQVIAGTGLTGGGALSGDVTLNVGTVAIANGGTGQTTATAAFNALDPLTSLGDYIIHNGTDSIRVAANSVYRFTDEFTYGNSATLTPWDQGGTGGATISAEAGRPGILTVDCTTTATGGKRIFQNIASVQLGGGVYWYECSVKIPNLSDATDEYDFRIGLGDTTAGAHTDGVYFEYDRNNSVNWIGWTAKAGARSSVDTTSAVSAGTWVRLGFLVNAAATSVQFYVNGVAAGAAVTTNIPDTASNLCGLHIQIVASAGSVAADRSAMIDYVDAGSFLTTPR